MIPTDVLERVKAAVDIVEVIGREIPLKRSGSAWTACCPFHEEKTPSFNVSPARQRWKCFGACQVSGDVLDFLELRHGWTLPEAVRALAAERGIVVDDEVAAPPVRTAAPRPVRNPPPPPKRLPVAEVERLWASTVPVAADLEAAEYVRHERGLDPESIDLWGAARVLPIGAPTPAWARAKGMTWTESGHRLLLRTWDAAGTFAGLRARSVRPVAEGEQKSLAPSGASTRGLVFACPLAVQMLRGQRPDVLAVAVVEGEIDHLAALTIHVSDADEDAPAILGVVADSWTSELASRIPDGSTVATWTHDDEAGERYASTIAVTVAGRCTFLRGRFPRVVSA